MRKIILIIGIVLLVILNGNHIYQVNKSLNEFDNEPSTNNPELVANLISKSNSESRKILYINLTIISGLLLIHFATKRITNSKWIDY